MDRVELRTDNVLTTADDAVISPGDARSLHAWPDSLPDPDGEPITVAVMDSGIHADAVDSHPWFDGVDVVDRYDATGGENGADEVGHGTACASIYARNTPAVELIDVRIFGDSGQGGFGPIRDAYRWMVEHAADIDVANLSWGARSNNPVLNALHERLMDAGVHDVVAAGNTGDDGGSPSTAKRAFSAGAVDEAGDPARFSSLNPERDNPDVAAAGVNVKLARAPGTAMGTPLDDQFVKASGTSFAAPYTGAGYVNALYARRVSWDRRFEQAAPDIPGTKKDGSGLFKLAPALDGEEPEAPNPRFDAATWDISGDVIWMDADRLPKNLSTTAELLDETKEHVDIRIQK